MLSAITEKLSTMEAFRPAIHRDGSIVCGSKKYLAAHESDRMEILRLFAQSELGRLTRQDCERELIASRAYVQTHVKNPLYFRRINNVAKTMSRLRQDLADYFADVAPPGITWICYSERIDGWLLYRLPALGCDGDFHW